MIYYKYFKYMKETGKPLDKIPEVELLPFIIGILTYASIEVYDALNSKDKTEKNNISRVINMTTKSR